MNALNQFIHKGILWVRHPDPYGPGFVRPLPEFEAQFGDDIPELTDAQLVSIFIDENGRCFGGDALFNAMVEAFAVFTRPPAGNPGEEK